MINDNKGNPYHDESGKFTSKEGQGSGAKKSEPLMDLYGSLMNTLNSLYPEKMKKKEESPVLKQMGLSEKELDREETDRNIAKDFVAHLNNNERIHFAGLDIGLDNIDDFTDVKGSLEDKLYDIVSKKGNYNSDKKDEYSFDTEDVITPESHISVNLPDGGSDLVFVENMGDKLLEFIGNEKELTEEQKQFIKENGYLPRELNPFRSDEEFEENFEEWLKDNYYPDKN